MNTMTWTECLLHIHTFGFHYSLTYIVPVLLRYFWGVCFFFLDLF